jgi:soluble lytic murein transglycosylase-like protein
MRLLAFSAISLAIPLLAQPAAARVHARHHVLRHVSHQQYAHRDSSWVASPYAGRAEQVGENHGDLDAMIARHAAAEGVPESLVHRVVIRESRYHPHVIGAGGAMGLMQIKYGTARAMGYTGSPAGLLDPDTNLTYAVRYLAGALRVAHGNQDGAVMNYARGYYDGAKRQGFSPRQANAWAGSYASASPAERIARARTQAPRLDIGASDQQASGR